MKYTYAELKKMMEEAKEDAKIAIVNVLAERTDRNHRMSASEIASAAGVPLGTVVNWFAPWDTWGMSRGQYECSVSDVAAKSRLKVCREHMKEYTTYVNPLNPDDTVRLARERYMYWVEHI